MKQNQKQSKTLLKIGDKVKVIAGDQKGFLGNILFLSKKQSTVQIDGILPRIKFLKNSQGGESKKVEIPLAIHFSNVMLWDEKGNQVSRIGSQTIEGSKKRYFKKSGNFLN